MNRLPTPIQNPNFSELIEMCELYMQSIYLPCSENNVDEVRAFANLIQDAALTAVYGSEEVLRAAIHSPLTRYNAPDSSHS